MDTAVILERDDYNTRPGDRPTTQISDRFEESAKKVLAIYLAMNRPGEPPTGEVPPGSGELPPNEMLAMLLKVLALIRGGQLPELPGQAPQKGKR